MTEQTGYITFHGSNIVEVRCKGCPTPIVHGPAKTLDYAELVIAMREPNGVLSKHETGMCKACRDRLVNDGPRPGELEALYACDIEQMVMCAIRGGMSPAEAMTRVERMVVRVPLRVLNEKGRGES